MRVRLGWSGETEPNVWAKADIELEEDDVARFMREHDLPDGIEGRLPISVVYILLSAEAEQLLLTRLLRQHGYPADKASKRIAELENIKADLLDVINTRLAGQPA